MFVWFSVRVVHNSQNVKTNVQHCLPSVRFSTDLHNCRVKVKVFVHSEYKTCQDLTQAVDSGNHPRPSWIKVIRAEQGRENGRLQEGTLDGLVQL